jgi:hypothetical protein
VNFPDFRWNTFNHCQFFWCWKSWTISRDWIAVRKWTVIAALTFVTPQVYILAAAHHAPRDVYVIIITVLVLLALVTIVSLVVKIRRAISGNLPKERLKKPSQPT